MKLLISLIFASLGGLILAQDVTPRRDAEVSSFILFYCKNNDIINIKKKVPATGASSSVEANS